MLMWVHMYVEARGQCSVSSSVHFALWGPLTEYGSHWLTRLGQCALEICLLPYSQRWGYNTGCRTQLLCGCWGAKFGSSLLYSSQFTDGATSVNFWRAHLYYGTGFLYIGKFILRRFLSLFPKGRFYFELSFFGETSKWPNDSFESAGMFIVGCWNGLFETR